MVAILKREKELHMPVFALVTVLLPCYCPEQVNSPLSQRLFSDRRLSMHLDVALSLVEQ